MILLRQNSAGLSRRCRDMQAVISAYVDGELEGDENVRARCRVEEHVKRCAGCSAVLEQWALDAVVLAVPRTDVPGAPWFTQRFAQRLAEEEAATWTKRSSAWLQSWSVTVRWFFMRSVPVAVVAFGLLLGFGLRLQLDSRAPLKAGDTALANGYSEVEGIALTANRIGRRSSASGPALRFDEVLRPGGESLVLAVARAPLADSPAGVDLAVQSEKDR